MSSPSPFASTSPIAGLDYLRFECSDLVTWARFATEVLGMAVEEIPGGIGLRMDALPRRITLVEGPRDALTTLGWQVRGPGGLDDMASRLQRVGLTSGSLSASECGERSVAAGLWFTDHDDFRHEVVEGFGPAGDPPVLHGVSGFVTGELGLGHVVLGTADLDHADLVFGQVMGMTLRENIATAGGPRGHFFGCNPRHHSVAALAGTTGPPLRHFMVEMAELDDVGTALDRAIAGGWGVNKTMGRHYTDNVLSCYLATPSGFEVEVGFGGLLVDDRVWDEGMKKSTRRRAWGHRPPVPAAGPG